MQVTPTKGFITKNSSLRTQIEKKLLTDKKLDTNKENFKKYHSHVKNSNQNNFFSCQNHQSFQTMQIDKTHHQNLVSFESESITIEKSLIDEKIILQYESLENPNFYGYSEWQELNHKIFSQVEQRYIKNLWKIMRTINYGDALIPTGLIYQVIQKLTSKENSKAYSLKEILNNFLQINNSSDRINNFRQLKNYLSLQEIQKGYEDHRKIEKKTSTLKNSIIKDLKNSSIQKNVFDRNYEDYKKRNLSKNKEMQKRLIQKQLDPQCLFKPQINQYFPKKLFIDEQLRPSRTCHSNTKWMTQKLMNNEFSHNFNFKATPFERSILQCQSLQQIPGATQHIDRYKDSETKKRRINRYNQRPTQVFRNY